MGPTNPGRSNTQSAKTKSRGTLGHASSKRALHRSDATWGMHDIARAPSCDLKMLLKVSVCAIAKGYLSQMSNRLRNASNVHYLLEDCNTLLVAALVATLIVIRISNTHSPMVQLSARASLNIRSSSDAIK